VLHELATGLPLLVRRSTFEVVDAARGPRGLEATVFVRDIAEPIRVREQANDIACELGACLDRCRMCTRAMPGAGKFDGVCGECVLAIEGCRR
jgi:hypothetical protein